MNEDGNLMSGSLYLVSFTLCNTSTHYHVKIGGIAYRDSECKKVGNLISSYTLLPAVKI
jgi:hypothetical protein